MHLLADLWAPNPVVRPDDDVAAGDALPLAAANDRDQRGNDVGAARGFARRFGKGAGRGRNYGWSRCEGSLEFKPVKGDPCTVGSPGCRAQPEKGAPS